MTVAHKARVSGAEDALHGYWNVPRTLNLDDVPRREASQVEQHVAVAAGRIGIKLEHQSVLPGEQAVAGSTFDARFFQIAKRLEHERSRRYGVTFKCHACEISQAAVVAAVLFEGLDSCTSRSLDFGHHAVCSLTECADCFLDMLLEVVETLCGPLRIREEQQEEAGVIGTRASFRSGEGYGRGVEDPRAPKANPSLCAGIVHGLPRRDVTQR